MIQYSRSALESFQKALNAILDGDIRNTEYGICYNAQLIAETSCSAYHMVASMCQDWEGFNGCRYYPISDDRYYGKWEGQNLRMRRSLAHHLLHKTKHTIQDHDIQDNKETILKSLVTLKDMAINGECQDKYPVVGICFALSKILQSNGINQLISDMSYRFVSVNATDWEHTQYPNKVHSMPVPNNPLCGYWKGENLTMRLSLIDHLITKVS